jgi:hypothetical protein
MMKPYAVVVIFIACLIGLSFVPGQVCAVVESPPVGKSPQLQDLEQFWLNQYGSSSPVQIQKSKSLKSSPTVQATPIQPGPWATTEWSLLAKAPADECYYGIGNPGNGPLSAANLPDCTGGKPKVNQAYVWGLTKSDKNVWFSTVANTHCLVMDIYMGVSIPFENTSWVCEFDTQPTTDFRYPKVYSYDTRSDTLTDKTSLIVSPLLLTTVGIRSAGSLGNLVIFGGPDYIAGINLFAFNNDTGAFIGAINLPGYYDIRKWLVVNNVLYTAVGTNGGGGRVLRWNGTVSNPWLYEEVGILDNEGSELAFHEGRIFVATWPDLSLAISPVAGIFMSPPVPPGGLTNALHNVPYTKVWGADDYEPDIVVAHTYAGGALSSYQGDLYWGTMHVPFLSTLAAVQYLDVDPDNDGLEPNEVMTTALGTYRAISIFRGHDLTGGTPQIEILYGLQYMPVYDPAQQMYTFAFDSAHQNKMPDPVPKWGLAGFGNFFNAYTWSMAEYNDKLYIGTFDWSYLLAQGLLGILLGPIVDPALINQLYQLQDQINFPWYVWGADLYRIDGSSGPAIPEDVAGLGNFTNYGIRNMIHGSGLYLGMANPMNLLTDTNDALPEGGWELISLNDPYAIPTLTDWGILIFIVLSTGLAVYRLRKTLV